MTLTTGPRMPSASNIISQPTRYDCHEEASRSSQLLWRYYVQAHQESYSTRLGKVTDFMFEEIVKKVKEH